jgi:hypothetical protein
MRTRISRALQNKPLANTNPKHWRPNGIIAVGTDRAVMAFTVLLALAFITSFRLSLAQDVTFAKANEVPSSLSPSFATLAYLSVAGPILWGWLGDRWSSAVACFAAFGVQSLLFVALALVGSGWPTELDSILLEGMNFCWLPIGAILIVTHFGPQRRPFLFSLLLLVSYLGLTTLPQVSRQFGWRAVAIAFGVGPMITAVASLLFLPTAEMRRANNETIRLDRAWLAPMIAYVLADSAETAANGYWFGGVSGQSSVSIGTLWAVTRFAGIVAVGLCWLIGWRTHTLRTRPNRSLWSLVLAVAAVGAAVWISLATVPSIALALLFFSGMIAFRAVQCASLASVVPPAYIGRMIGFQMMAAGVGSIVVQRWTWSAPSQVGAWPLSCALLAASAGVFSSYRLNRQ